METPQLIHRLKLLQRRLCELADDLGNLTNPEIVAVSEEADRLIIQLQRLRKEEAEERKRSGADSSGSILSGPQLTEELSEQARTFVTKNS